MLNINNILRAATPLRALHLRRWAGGCHLIIILILFLTTTAQADNTLSVPDVTAGWGTTIALSVNMENSDANVAAVQFTLELPDGATLRTDRIEKSERIAAHTVSVRQTERGKYTFIILSSEGQAIRGYSGTLLTVDMQIGSPMSEGHSYPMTITNAVMSLNTGENVLQETTAGTITVARSTDFTVSNVTVSQTETAPGETIDVSWTVSNIGEVAATGGWHEQVLLVSFDGEEEKLLGTVYNDESALLDPGASVSRTARVKLPQLLGIDGDARVRVRLVPDSGSGERTEAQGNNTATSGTLLNVSKQLLLQLPTGSILENSSPYIEGTLLRTGSWRNDETFMLSITGDDRLPSQLQVTIPARQSSVRFQLPVANNDVVDESSVFLLSVEGNGYAAVTEQIVIEDDELPALTVTASKLTVSEGETFQLTISRSYHLQEALTVMLTCEHPARFTYPQQVTIPAGQQSVTVEVTAKDDDLPGETLSTAFVASTPRYEKGEAIVLLEDDDMPVLQLSLVPCKVQEGAGPVSVAGILRRTGITTNKITVRLSDDSHGGLYFGTRELVLTKGVEEVSFNFGPVDNAQVDGDHTYTVTAAVWLSSCSCSAAGESAGSVSTTLEVLDDDGPALTLTSSLSTIKEGGKAMLTVGRNTLASLDQPLIVHLSSDYDDNLSYNHTVTIPAGQQTAQVEVTSTKNDVGNDTHTAVFTAQAEGFASATCYMMITDQNLPDAVITAFETPSVSIVSGEKYQLTVKLYNAGFQPLPPQTAINIYLTDDHSLFGQMFTQQPLAAGEQTVVTKVFQPSKLLGTYHLYAIVNEAHNVPELQYTNNTSSTAAICFQPPFTATVKADKQRYLPGENVSLTGSVTGVQVSEKEVEVYFICNGVRQVVLAVSDSQGAFTCSWKPLSKVTGHVAVGACVPGESLDNEQTSFDVVGLNVEDRDRDLLLYVEEVHHDSLLIANSCGIDLTDIRLSLQSDGDDLEVWAAPVARVEKGTVAALHFDIKGKSPTDADGWRQLPLLVSCAEGGSTPCFLNYHVYMQSAKLQAGIDTIRTTMTKGRSRDYPLVIRNVGKGSTGRITVDTGKTSWLSCMTPQDIPSIEQGDSVVVSLRFTADSDMSWNNTITGRIAVNCENGEGCVIGLMIEPVSEATGKLVVDVWDEYTYFTPDAPHVQDATVIVMHPVSHRLLAKSLTAVDGCCTFELPEGQYYLEVSKEKHDTYAGYVIIDPGREKHLTATLLLQTIEVAMEYEQTEVEDLYSITTTLTYETNVPTPIVIAVLPDSIPVLPMRCGESLLFNAVMVNKGLVTALDAQIEFPAIPGLKFTILENATTDLSAQQSIVVPVLVTRVCLPDVGVSSGTSHGGIEVGYPGADNADIPCFIPVYIRYDVPCYEKKRKGYTRFIGLKPCAWSAIAQQLATHESSPHGGGGGGGGDTSIRSGNKPIIIDECDDPYHYNNAYVYLGKFIECLVKGMGANLPVFGTGFKVAFCIDDLEQLWKNKNRTEEEVAKWTLDCLDIPSDDNSELNEEPSAKKLLSPFTSFFGCQHNLQQFYDSVQYVRFSRRAPSQTMPDYIRDYQERLNVVASALHGEIDFLHEFFGDSIYLQSEIWQLRELTLYLSTLPEGQLADPVMAYPYKPDNVPDEAFVYFIERSNNTKRLHHGEAVNSDNYIRDEKLDSAIGLITTSKEYAESRGFISIHEMANDLVLQVEKRYDDVKESICAKVTVQIEQTVALSRPAIRATLTIKNGHEEKPVTALRLFLDIKDDEGKAAEFHDFDIHVEELENLEGEPELTAGWTLDAQETGKATVLVIPTKYAAPIKERVFRIGGSLTYEDPFTGIEMTRILAEQYFTVQPLPDLELTYLMQRDVYGDDPLTKDVVEPMEEAEFALIINNKGYGEAKNVRMVTEQPKIVENEKGLFIDFDIVRSQVNGEPAVLSLGQTIANDFGNIGAHSQSYAQWWLRSSLLGHFTSYEVEANHVTSYGNQDLSLIDTVTIHEMIHGFSVAAVKHGLTPRGYLVNDIVDADDLPDIVYFTDATQQPLSIATGTIERRNNSEFLLIVTPRQEGWNYGSVPDPTGGRQKLIGITRSSDGMIIPLDNVWQTDRTLHDGRDWFYENRLHFVGEMGEEGETFVLIFEPKPDVELAVEHFLGVPDEHSFLTEPLKELTVVFNKAVQNETFTTDDLTLFCQGNRQDASDIIITPMNTTTYHLGLEQTTHQDGYYVLTVQTAGITDTEGFRGSVGKTASWTQVLGQGQGIETPTTDADMHVRISARGDWLTVTGDFRELRSVDVYDLRGMKRIQTMRVQAGQAVYIGLLPRGVYDVQVATDRGTMHVKMLKR